MVDATLYRWGGGGSSGNHAYPFDLSEHLTSMN